MQRGGEHARESRRRQRDERGGGADESIERMRSVNRSEGRNRARRREDCRNVGARVAGRWRLAGRTVAAAHEFAGGDQAGRERKPQRDPHRRSEEALLDGIAHKQQRAERQRDAADDDRPAGADGLFEAAPNGCGLLRRRLFCRRLGRRRARRLVLCAWRGRTARPQRRLRVARSALPPSPAGPRRRASFRAAAGP